MRIKRNPEIRVIAQEPAEVKEEVISVATPGGASFTPITRPFANGSSAAYHETDIPKYTVHVRTAPLTNKKVVRVNEVYQDGYGGWSTGDRSPEVLLEPGDNLHDVAIKLAKGLKAEAEGASPSFCLSEQFEQTEYKMGWYRDYG